VGGLRHLRARQCGGADRTDRRDLADQGTASGTGAVKTVTQVACLLAGGVQADRLRRQYVMLAADGVRGAVLAALFAVDPATGPCAVSACLL
jgi:hypothetical protein